MKYHVPNAPVLRQEIIGQNIYALTIKSQEIASMAQPGQFVHFRCGQRVDLLLRRPLSINAVQREAGTVAFWYQVVGKGTKFLSQVQVGEHLDVIGPLGHGFKINLSGKKVGLIGGGMGIAPLIFLGRELVEQNQVQAFWGGRSRTLLPRIPAKLEFPYELITEDGSSGKQGLVTELLVAWLAQEGFDLLYACGPRSMLAEVASLARQRKIALQVSLETVMACGIGACSGCTCKGAGLAEGKQFKVCQDGPVFWAEEVSWDE